MSGFGMVRNVHPLFDVVHAAFPLPTMASPTLQDVLRNGFGEDVVACDVPEPCEFPSLGSRQKRFPMVHEEADLALHPVTGLVFQRGEKVAYVIWTLLILARQHHR